MVALRKESVDRNRIGGARQMAVYVALRKESVDRNITNELLTALKTVALRKESVDRNTSRVDANCSLLPSLSARRAWIEIPYVVRLCAGGLMSLSARRAWIEIFCTSWR